MAEVTVDELQRRIDDLEASRLQSLQTQAKQLQTQVEQLQQQLQRSTGAAISTMGQIEQLHDILAEQRRDRYQLEGMLRVLVAQQQQDQEQQ